MMQVKIPFNIGDKVYAIASTGVEEGIVGSISLFADRIYVYDNSGVMLGRIERIYANPRQAQAKWEMMYKDK